MQSGELKYEIVGRGAIITGYEGHPEVCVIPAQIDGIMVSGVAAHAFFGCLTLCSLTVSEGVEYIGEFCFCNCQKLAKIFLPDSLTKIGMQAFAQTAFFYNKENRIDKVLFCGRYLIKADEDIQGIFAVNGTLLIAEEAFSGCDKLGGVVLMDGLKYINDRAFEGCGITQAILPNGVIGVGCEAFARCSRLCSASFPDSLCYIAESVFEGTPLLSDALLSQQASLYVGRHLIRCGAMGKFAVRKNTLLLAESAFLFCKVEVVTLPPCINKIPQTCFYGCAQLYQLQSSALTVIEEGAFAYCSSLTKLSFSSSCVLMPFALTGCSIENAPEPCDRGGDVVYIGRRLCRAGYSVYAEYKVKYGTLYVDAGAFEGNKRLTKLYLPDTVRFIGKGFAKNCTYLKSLTLSKRLQNIPEELCAHTSVIEVDVPSGVKALGARAFFQCAALKKVVLPKGLTTIEESVFEGCSSLSNASLPLCVKHIEKRAFYGCIALNEVVFPADLELLEQSCYENCRTLKALVIPNKVEKISESAFKGCSSVKSVMFSEELKVIERKAFYGCSSLESAPIPSGTMIGSGSFENCYSLLSVTISNNRIIGADTFKNCRSLTTVFIKSGATGIGKEAFAKCENLIELQLPPTVNNIAEKALAGCSSLKSLALPDGITLGQDAFRGCISLKFIIAMPQKENKLGSIGAYAFEGCTALEKAILPDRLTSLGAYSFAGCERLSQVRLPEGLVTVGERAFCGDKELKELYLPKSVSRLGKYCISGCRIIKQNLVELLKTERGMLVKFGGNTLVYNGGELCVPEFEESCFSDEGWMQGSLSGYDCVFAELTEATESVEDYVRSRLLYPFLLSEKNKKLFISGYLQNIAQKAVDAQDTGTLRLLADNGCFSASILKTLLESSSKMGALGVTSLLLDVLRKL